MPAAFAFAQQVDEGLFVEQPRDDRLGVGRADAEGDALAEQAELLFLAG